MTDRARLTSIPIRRVVDVDEMFTMHADQQKQSRIERWQNSDQMVCQEHRRVVVRPLHSANVLIYVSVSCPQVIPIPPGPEESIQLTHWNGKIICLWRTRFHFINSPSRTSRIGNVYINSGTEPCICIRSWTLASHYTPLATSWLWCHGKSLWQ